MVNVSELLAEAIEMRQSEYYRRYLADPDSLTNKEFAIAEFFQACLGNNRRAIEHLMDRTDGPLATPVQIIYPKIYHKWPFAPPPKDLPKELPKPDEQKSYSEPEPKLDDSPLKGLRQTIKKMSAETVKLRNDILEAYQLNQEQLRIGGVISPDLRMGSVVAANFLRMSSSPQGAIALFDQLDGKIATVFKALGDDVYLLETSTTPPKEAIWSPEQNAYILEVPTATNQWVEGLKLLEQSKQQ